MFRFFNISRLSRKFQAFFRTPRELMDRLLKIKAPHAFIPGSRFQINIMFMLSILRVLTEIIYVKGSSQTYFSH